MLGPCLHGWTLRPESGTYGCDVHGDDLHPRLRALVAAMAVLTIAAGFVAACMAAGGAR